MSNTRAQRRGLPLVTALLGAALLAGCASGSVDPGTDAPPPDTGEDTSNGGAPGVNPEDDSDTVLTDSIVCKYLSTTALNLAVAEAGIDGLYFATRPSEYRPGYIPVCQYWFYDYAPDGAEFTVYPLVDLDPPEWDAAATAEELNSTPLSGGSRASEVVQISGFDDSLRTVLYDDAGVLVRVVFDVPAGEEVMLSISLHAWPGASEAELVTAAAAVATVAADAIDADAVLAETFDN